MATTPVINADYLQVKTTTELALWCKKFDLPYYGHRDVLINRLLLCIKRKNIATLPFLTQLELLVFYCERDGPSVAPIVPMFLNFKKRLLNTPSSRVRTILGPVTGMNKGKYRHIWCKGKVKNWNCVPC